MKASMSKKNIEKENSYLILLPWGKEICVDDAWFAARTAEQLQGITILRTTQHTVEVIDILED